MLRPVDLFRDTLCLAVLILSFALLGAYLVAVAACRNLRRLARSNL